MTARELSNKMGSLIHNGLEYIYDMQLSELFLWAIGIIICYALYLKYNDNDKKEDDFLY